MSVPKLGFVRSLRAAVCAVALLGCAGTENGLQSSSPGSDAPKLVLMLAIDQLRPDRLSDEQSGGLGRLQREGRTFVDAALVHAFTETCPGHATMLTGRHPAKIGVPGNGYTDPESLEGRYCVEDRAADARVIGLARESGDPEPSPSDGRSPRMMRASTLGDWMKAQRSGTRVFSVSGKDRSAITLAGRDADAAYWLARGESPRFVTSAYYMDALPSWVADWRDEKVVAHLPPVWEYLPASIDAMTGGPRADAYAFESPVFGRAAPHPVRQDPPRVEQLPAQLRHPADRAYATPFADEVTLAFARELVERENLGGGAQTDLLAVALSATDLVGHFYGPESWESRDALERLDAALGSFLDFLEARVGAGGLVVAVTADHGVLPLPEWIQETGRSQCRLPNGRLSGKQLVAGLDAHLDARFGSADDVSAGPGWFGVASSRLTLNRARAARARVPVPEILDVAREHLEAVEGVTRVWTRDEVLSGEGPEPFATLYRNSWDAKITGDLALQLDEDCLLSDRRIATSHGSPYAYDRRVPLVFFGAGIEPGRVAGDAATVDIAPTLAGLLGIDAPDDLDGRPLPLR